MATIFDDMDLIAEARSAAIRIKEAIEAKQNVEVFRELGKLTGLIEHRAVDSLCNESKAARLRREFSDAMDASKDRARDASTVAHFLDRAMEDRDEFSVLYELGSLSAKVLNFADSRTPQQASAFAEGMEFATKWRRPAKPETHFGGPR